MKHFLIMSLANAKGMHTKSGTALKETMHAIELIITFISESRNSAELSFGYGKLYIKGPLILLHHSTL